MSEAVIDKVHDAFAAQGTRHKARSTSKQTNRMKQGVCGVCVADELGLCVAAAGSVDPRSAGLVADIAQTAQLLFTPDTAASTVTFIEAQKTFAKAQQQQQRHNNNTR